MGSVKRVSESRVRVKLEGVMEIKGVREVREVREAP
jgi:hypothetical protein